MDQKFLSIDFDSWNELSGLLMTVRKLVQKIQVANAKYIGIRQSN